MNDHNLQGAQAARATSRVYYQRDRQRSQQPVADRAESSNPASLYDDPGSSHHVAQAPSSSAAQGDYWHYQDQFYFNETSVRLPALVLDAALRTHFSHRIVIQLMAPFAGVRYIFTKTRLRKVSNHNALLSPNTRTLQTVPDTWRCYTMIYLIHKATIVSYMRPCRT